jgi:Fe-S cluster assembly protein SufD
MNPSENSAAPSLLALRAKAVDSIRDGEPDWIGRMRDEALREFEAQGFPTRRLEDWKSTNLAPLEKMTFQAVGPSERNPVVVTGDGIPELRFIDGRLVTANTQAENLPAGVRLLSLAEARRQAPELLEGRLGQLASPKRAAMVALQTAFLDDGAVLAIDAGLELESPIRLCFTTTGDKASAPSAVFPRLLVVAGAGSRATIAIENESEAPGLTAVVAEYHLAAGAFVEAIQIQDENAGRVHFTSAHARLEAGARFDSHVLTLTPGLVRSELEVVLAEPECETRMRGFYLGREAGHVDHFTTVDHAAASCTSDEEYRGVLGDRSSGVFRGRVIVRPDAQKTDARQSNPNLLISDHARVDSKPQLEIYADDIRASHGSTTGQLDPNALFFLRTRGIGAAEAKLLLTRAFAQTIVDGIADDRLREAASARVDDALASLVSATDSADTQDAPVGGSAS